MVMDDVASKDINHTAVMSWARPMLAPRTMRMFRTVFIGELPGAEMVFVGDNGHCLSISAAGQERDEFVTPDADDSPKTIGHLRSATVVGDGVIAVGMQRQVYRRDPGGNWSPARRGLPAYGDGPTSGFEAVASVNSEEVYAAGWDGEIWQFDGKAWRRVDSPTNRIITGLGVDDNGAVYGCGRNGMVLSGRGDDWKMLEVGCPDDLWSIVPWGSRLFAAGLHRLYCIEDGKASIVDLGEIGANSFGVLTMNAGVLWSIGEKDVLSYDGLSWARIA